MYHNILVPVVFDNEHDITAPVKLAGILKTPEAKITFLHVIERVPSYAISYITNEFQNEMRMALHDELEKLAKHLPGAEGQVVEGHSGRTIVEYAKEHRNDLIIIASHRPGMEDYFLGSTASHVVRHASCAVHVVR
ncbi:universal stress protein [Sulfitobacter sp. SK012]|uniref:universal stress protein n=1 Tax=Sulfitobacter sp. SK012 TaxID=1389005 RepID=UPI000E0B3201|nr:universal stress protein [Sulfitobacter sp. SK012]AXI46942.1 universal stress protein [Sulfitobacter sp. SK012]